MRTVTERLHELQDVLGIDGILAEINSGGQIPAEGVRHSLRLLCEEVMPSFRRDIGRNELRPYLVRRPEVGARFTSPGDGFSPSRGAQWNCAPPLTWIVWR